MAFERRTQPRRQKALQGAEQPMPFRARGRIPLLP